MTASEKQVLSLINTQRTKRGLIALRADGGLATVSRRHSADMLRRQYFAHSYPGGSTVTSRLKQVCGAGILGEDIAWGSAAYSTPTSTVSRWMNSPPHRAIILTSTFRYLGVGRAAGTFLKNPGAAIYTADFCQRVR